MISYQQARDTILRAHRQFHAGALAKIYPAMDRRDRARAFAREQSLANTYVNRMSHRLSETWFSQV